MTELHTALASIAGGDKKEYQIQDLCKAFEITGKILILDIEDDTDWGTLQNVWKSILN